MQKKGIQTLLEESRDIDQDIRIMAANDLCSMLINNEVTQAMQRQICEVFLNHLNNNSIENQINILYQGNAIRCIGKAISKIDQTHVEEMIKILMDYIIKGKQEIQDVYSTCVKTIINEVSEDFAETICKNTIPPLIEGIKKNENKFHTLEELFELANAVFKQFTVFLYRKQMFNNYELFELLSKYLTSNQEIVRKKSCYCLGQLSQILSFKDINTICDKLVQEIQKIVKNPSKKPEMLYLLQSMHSLSKFAGFHLNQKVAKIAQILLDEINQQLDKDDTSNFISEYLEACLNVVENFLKLCPKEIQPYLKEILEKANLLICYDPNGTINQDEDDDQMELEEQQDEYEDYYDDYGSDDNSWRVRRAAIHLIDTMLKSRKEMTKDISFIAILNIIKRLREKDENIRLDAFAALNTYFKACVYEDFTENELFQEEFAALKIVRQKTSISNISDVVDQVIVELLSLLNSNNTTNIKIQASKLIFIASVCAVQGIIKSWDQFINVAWKYCSEKQHSNEVTVNLLIVIKRTMRSQISSLLFSIPENLKKISEICNLVCKHDDFKICAEGLKATSAFFKVLKFHSKQNQNYFNLYVNPLVLEIIQKLQDNDIDLEIKQASITASHSLISNFGDIISEQQICKIFELLLLKLKNENLRMHILKAFIHFPPPEELLLKITANLKKQLILIIQELQSYLQKQTKSLKISSLKALNVIIQQLKGNLDKEIVKSLQNSLLNLSEEEFYIVQLSFELFVIILELNPNCRSGIQIPLNNLVQLSTLSLLQGEILDQFIYPIQKLNEFNLIQGEQFIQLLVKQLQKENIPSIAKMSASICMREEDSALRNSWLKKCTQSILDNKESESLMIQFSLQFIRFLGKQHNLSQNTQLINGIINQFKSSNEFNKSYASLAFGGIGAGNSEKMIPEIIEMIKKSDENQYLLLSSLKEIIENSQSFPKPLIDVVPKLFEYSLKKEENIRNIIAVCIGRICYFKLAEINNHILQNLKSKEPNCKYTAATSFKYFCLKQKENQLELIMPLLNALFPLISDKDIHVRRTAINSLNTVIINMPVAFKQITPAFFQEILQNTKLIKELIKEVDFGAFKHKIDEGLPLRCTSQTFINHTINQLSQIVPIDNAFYFDSLSNGLQETSEDILNLTFSSICKLCNYQPGMIITRLDALTDLLKTVVDRIFKTLKGNQPGTLETCKLAAKALDAIKGIPETEQNPKFSDYYVTASQNYFKKLKEIENQ